MAHYKINLYSKALGRRTKVDLVIPSLNLHQSLGNKDDNYYCNSTQKYPLMIFLHGFGEDETGWQMNSNIVKVCEEQGIAGCFINGENKWYLDMGVIDNFYDLIERDIPDFLYGNFRCLDKSLPLGICGVSMGGYGSLYHYLRNPKKYQCCISMSPALKPDYLDETKYGTLKDLFIANKEENIKIYLSVGGDDFIIKQSLEFDDFLKSENIDVRYKVIPNMNHSWNTWQLQIPDIVEYLKETNFIKK